MGVVDGNDADDEKEVEAMDGDCDGDPVVFAFGRVARSSTHPG